MDKITICRENVRMLGIMRQEEGVWYLEWSASGLEFMTDAQKICAELLGVEEATEEDTYAYLGVFVDEKMTKKIRVERGRKQYTLYENKSPAKVKIRIIKLTEQQYDKVGICGLYADGMLSPTMEAEKKLLFIGDSITAGYGVEGKDGVSEFSTADEDVTKAYAYVTAETLGADCRIIAWSGNGVISRWIPPEEDEPYVENLMPDVFPFEQTGCPDVIVSYLGTNDASYIRQERDREQLFAEKYSTFLCRVHDTYPEAHVLLLCGLMENTLNKRIAGVAEENGFDCLQFPLQDEKDGLGTNGHPGPLIHQKAAEMLVEQLKRMMAW